MIRHDGGGSRGTSARGPLAPGDLNAGIVEGVGRQKLPPDRDEPLAPEVRDDLVTAGRIVLRAFQVAGYGSCAV